MVGVPWRNMLFFGPRGYRRMLIDCGRLLAHLETRAAGSGVGLLPVLDLYDARVDGVLNNDGTERTTLLALVIEERTS